MVTNANLQSARTARDDEFYTKYADVDAELSHYIPDLKGCRVYCGADGPESMFVRWMLDHWDALELSGLTATQVNLPDLTVGASVLSAEMIASGTAT